MNANQEIFTSEVPIETLLSLSENLTEMKEKMKELSELSPNVPISKLEKGFYAIESLHFEKKIFPILNYYGVLIH